MMRYRLLARLLLVGVLMLPVLLAPQPARANITNLVLHARTCRFVTAYAVYDSFSGGVAPFYAVFSIDLNGNGIFGEAGETTIYQRLNSRLGAASYVSARLYFPNQPEGSTIAVTVYEIDSAGQTVSAQLSPVAYQCTHRPALDPLPPNTGIAIPGVGVTARITVESVKVYSGPSAATTLIGGLGRGQLVNVRAQNARGDWVQVEFKGGLGWIMWHTQASLLGPYRSLPVAPNQ